jgi:hypothetical protein
MSFAMPELLRKRGRSAQFGSEVLRSAQLHVACRGKDRSEVDERRARKGGKSKKRARRRLKYSAAEKVAATKAISTKRLTMRLRKIGRNSDDKRRKPSEVV